MDDKKLLKHCSEENSLSYNELKLMTQEELDEVFSLCWKDAEFEGYSERTLRCSATGVRFLIYHDKHNVLDWSDDDGDPNIDYSDPNNKIHRIGDGTWTYGIYKSERQVKQEKRDKKINNILN